MFNLFSPPTLFFFYSIYCGVALSLFWWPVCIRKHEQISIDTTTQKKKNPQMVAIYPYEKKSNHKFINPLTMKTIYALKSP